MNELRVAIQENDGPCRAWVMTPRGEGQWPAVIFYMDGFGIRPCMRQMAAHLAGKGYVVLLPDLFYRFGDYEPLDPGLVLKGDVRATVGPLMASTDNHRAGDDTAAARYPERIAAAASFHGGNLATEEPTSPQLLLPRIKAELYIAVAENDHSYPPGMAARFEAALAAARVRFKSELHRGKAHGWMKPDLPVYDAEAAEKGWNELLALYARTLG